MVSGASILGFIVGFYMLLISPTKKDIRRIEGLVKASIDQKQSFLPTLVPGIAKELESARIEELEKDIRRVESSIFFSLSSETYFDIASFYFDQSKLRKALEYLDKAITRKPQYQKALLLRSIVRLFIGSYKDALADTDIVISSEQDEDTKTAAVLIKGFVSYLIGDLRASKDLLLRVSAPISKRDDLRPILILCYYLIADNCFSLGEYDDGDYFYSKGMDIGNVLEKLEQKDAITTIVLALINIEGSAKTMLDNYERLAKLTEETVFRDLILFFYKMAASANDFDAFSTYANSAIAFCNEHELIYLTQFFEDMLFESWLDNKGSIRKDLMEDVTNSSAKIPTLEADAYFAAGKFSLSKKDFEPALRFLNEALNRYSVLGSKMKMIEAKFYIYFTESDLRNHYNSYKMLRSVREDINALLKQNPRVSYASKRANEDIALLKLQKENVEKLLPIVEKYFQ